MEQKVYGSLNGERKCMGVLKEINGKKYFVVKILKNYIMIELDPFIDILIKFRHR